MKYVLFETPDGMPEVRIFEDLTSHIEVRNEVLSDKPGLKLVSAGKIWFSTRDDGSSKCTCVHSSVTLGMFFDGKKSEEATTTIARVLNFSV